MIADCDIAPPPELKRKLPPSSKGQKRPRHDWQAIRKAYMTGCQTIASLAVQFAVPASTIGKRMASEQWRTKGKTEMSTKAIDIAANKVARQVNAGAERLINRSLAQVDQLLDTVDQDLKEGFNHVLQPDGTIKETRADKLGKVVSAWQKVIAVGRQAHGLGDGPQLHVVRHISALQPTDNEVQVIDVEQVANEIVVECPTSAIESSS